MSETWHVFKLEELDSISIECPICNTRVVFPANLNIASGKERKCCGCNNDIPGADALLKLYREFYQEGMRPENLKINATLRVRGTSNR